MVASETDKEIIIKEINMNSENGFFNGKEVVVFGCTLFAKHIKDALEYNGIKISAFVDNSGQKAGRECMGIKVFLPESFLMPFKSNRIIIVCSKYHREMAGQLMRFGYLAENILNIPVNESIRIGGDSLEVFQKEAERVKTGYLLYQDLCKTSIQKIFVCPYPGTGDIYMACSYLQEYLLKNNIKKYILVVTKDSCRRVALLFSIPKVSVLSHDAVQNLLKAWEFLGNNVMKVKPLLYWGWRTKKYLYVDKHPQITFTEMFMYDVYGFQDIVQRQVPCKKNIFQLKNLTKGKTVIISPYAGSFESSITAVQWEKIVARLKEKGYAVCTNCYGNGEQALPGTKSISFPYDEAIDILEFAGGFIAVRSGLCDIVSSARCKMIIIYENGFNASRYEYFSLKRMGLNREVKEVIVTKNIINDIIDNF